MYFVQFDLLELQRFCFQRSSCHSFYTLSFLYEYRIYHYVEFITGQKFLVFCSSHGVLYIEGVKTKFCLWSYFIIFTKTNQLWTENSKMTGLKYCRTSQENVSFSLAKRKLDQKSEWKLSYQSGDVMYASIYLTSRRKSFFFFGSLFRV